MADKELLPTIGYAHDIGGRPNLEDRVALMKLGEGWWIVRQRAKREAQQAS